MCRNLLSCLPMPPCCTRRPKIFDNPVGHTGQLLSPAVWLVPYIITFLSCSCPTPKYLVQDISLDHVQISHALRSTLHGSDFHFYPFLYHSQRLTLKSRLLTETLILSVQACKKDFTAFPLTRARRFVLSSGWFLAVPIWCFHSAWFGRWRFHTASPFSVFRRIPAIKRIELVDTTR